MKEALPVYSADIVAQAAHHEGEKAYGFFQGLRLSSVFQPIFSLAHKRIVGYEALVRAVNIQGKPVRPDLLFQRGDDLAGTVFLDRLCRHLHLENFQTFPNDDINWLFLNVSPQTITHGRNFGSFFTDLLERHSLPPHRVVIEIVEHPFSTDNNRHLTETIKYYQDLGCLTAIDDFGAGHSNFDRIWTLKPDLVKLDRSMLELATSRKEIRQLLPGIVSLLHQAGALVIMEGIETEAQAIIAMESDIDMVQGYYFAKPHHNLNMLSETRPPFEALFGTYKTMEAALGNRLQKTYQRYYKQFLTTVALLQEGCAFIDSTEPLFEDDTVIRCWLLDPSGQQIGSTITSRAHAGKNNPKYRPLEDARSADWYRRHYMKRAIMHPGQLQITRPYLSITGAHMCITLSMMFKGVAGDIILCCDLKA